MVPRPVGGSRPLPATTHYVVGVAKRFDPLEVVRSLAMSLPEVSERLSHGLPTFFIRGKKTFLMFVDDHHGDGIVGIWCAASLGAQAELVDDEPDRFFVPPYVGGRGWIGVRLEHAIDRDELAAIITEAYLQVAPAKLAIEVRAAQPDAAPGAAKM